MSADNWTICPRCFHNWKTRSVFEMEAAKDSYGKIPQEEFIQKLATAEVKAKVMIQPTLREDYEIGVDEKGMFGVGYTCTCNVCGFKFRFEHQEKLSIFDTKKN